MLALEKKVVVIPILTLLTCFKTKNPEVLKRIIFFLTLLLKSKSEIRKSEMATIGSKKKRKHKHDLGIDDANLANQYTEDAKILSKKELLDARVLKKFRRHVENTTKDEEGQHGLEPINPPVDAPVSTLQNDILPHEYIQHNDAIVLSEEDTLQPFLAPNVKKKKPSIVTNTLPSWLANPSSVPPLMGDISTVSLDTLPLSSELKAVLHVNGIFSLFPVHRGKNK